MQFLFETLFTKPLYNALIFLVDIVPGGSVGLAVILLTIVVRFILFPLTQKSLRTQIIQRALQPELEAIKKEYADDRQLQAVKTMELYKEKGVNPFSGCLLVLIQLPIIIAVYRVFLMGVSPDIDLLYSFVEFPQTFQTIFLGLFDLEATKVVVLALLAGVAQYWQIYFTRTGTQKVKESEQKDKKQEDEVAKPFDAQNMGTMLQKQMQYMMPVMVVAFSYFVPAAVALYWFTSNVFAIGQELYLRRVITKEQLVVTGTVLDK